MKQEKRTSWPRSHAVMHGREQQPMTTCWTLTCRLMRPQADASPKSRPMYLVQPPAPCRLRRRRQAVAPRSRRRPPPPPCWAHTVSSVLRAGRQAGSTFSAAAWCAGHVYQGVVRCSRLGQARGKLHVGSRRGQEI